MKCRVWRTVLATVLSGMILPVFAQKNYYVIVGAFSTEQESEEIIARLPKNGSDTAYSMGDQNLVHLYVLKTQDEQTAVNKSMQLQKSIDELRKSDGSYESLMISKAGDEKIVTVKTELGGTAEIMNTESSSSRGTENLEPAATTSVPVKSRANLYKFALADEKGKPIPGKIHFVDFKRERELGAYSANTYTDIMHPGKNREVAVVTGVFGYKEKAKLLDHSNPTLFEGAYRDESGSWVVPYEMERLEKGDVSVMYNVSFHKDAVVMMPQSKTDLDELVRMMYENPEYEITIHGHVNGKHDRKIMDMGAKNYFEVKGTREFIGSAKQLSDLRATAIRQYLVDHGIASSRIRTFAWGGRYMLVDSRSSASKLNDRIEIEIRKD